MQEAAGRRRSTAQKVRKQTFLYREIPWNICRQLTSPFSPKNDIPCCTISVTQQMTSHDVAHEVYTVIREEMCAEGGTKHCTHSDDISDAFC